ncbi:MAG: ABC transporter permease [Bryobacterales bacterium]|nr:ABC transporter permease [Bryobacterales bacterium]
MQELLRDLRYGLRMLANEPLLTLAAAFSIAIGVAANTTVFTYANKVLFEPLPVADRDGLMAIYQRTSKGKAGATLSWPDLDDVTAETRTFRSVARYFPLTPASLVVDGAPAKRLWGQLVSGNYFDVAGITAARGRTFVADEDRVPGRDQVVVLSDHIWRSAFAADPSLVGRTIRLNQRQVTVVGIAPPGFRGVDRGLVADFWVPLALLEQMMPRTGVEDRRTGRNVHWLFAIARLQPGVNEQQARTALRTLSQRLEKDHPNSNRNLGFTLERAGQFNPGFRPTLVTFLGLLLVIMLLVLLIACANVANLLLARATRRSREFATRLAMGAGRARLVRQLLTEGLLLASLGALIAVGLTYYAKGAIGALQLPMPVPLDLGSNFDWRVALFTLGITVFTTVAFGLAPALSAARLDVISAMRTQAAAGISARRWNKSNFLVVGQMAMAMLLLTGTILMLRSLGNANRIQLGFDPRNVMLVTLDPTLDGFSRDDAPRMMKQVQDRLSQLPGVVSVSYTDMLPLSMGGQSTGVTNEEGNRNEGGKEINTDFYRVGDRYIETLSLRVVEGSTDLHRASDVLPVLINQTLAKRLWPEGGSVVGRRFDAHRQKREVIGVVTDSKSRTLDEDPAAIMYEPLQRTYEGSALFGLRLLVRTAAGNADRAAQIRREIQTVSANLSVFDIHTMDEHVTNARILPRLAASLFGFAGGAALLLAITGLFGVVHYSVSRRVRDIGIRIALGADRRHVVGMVLRQGLLLALLGSALGLAAAAAGMPLLGSILYGVKALDPVTFLIAPLTLLLTAAAACAIPARRAARLEPWQALRED